MHSLLNCRCSDNNFVTGVIDDNSLSINEISKITKEVCCVFIESRSTTNETNFMSKGEYEFHSFDFRKDVRDSLVC